MIDQIACRPGLLDALAGAHAHARAHVWKHAAAPEGVTIDIDATLITSHSEKEGAAGTFKGGFGFHPLMAYCDETGEALAAILRPGNAGSNTAATRSRSSRRRLSRSPADFRISFARRSSKFSARSLRISSRSTVDGRSGLAPLSARLAHLLAQRLRVHAEIGRDMRDRAIALQRQPHAASHELVGVLLRSGHDEFFLP